MKPTILIVQDGELSYDRANQSRLLYIAAELNKLGYNTILIGKYSMILSNNNIQDLPIKSFLSSKDSIFERIIQDIQTYIIAIRYILFLDIRYVYVKGSLLFLLALFAKIFRKSVIFEIRDSLRFTRGYKFTKFLESIMEAISDHIIVVSEGMKLLLPAKHHKKTLVLDNSVDNSEFEKTLSKQEIEKLKHKYNIPDNLRTIGFFGVERDVFHIEDLAEVQQHLNGVVSLIVYNLSSYKQKALSYNNVITPGIIPHNDVIMLLKYVVDICILPYDKDFEYNNIKNYHSARKISEYVASGKPIISSNVRGLPMYLKENENHLTYESENPKKLAEKIKLLLENEELYKKLCKNNLNLAKEITWEQRIKKSGLIEIISGK